MKYYNLGIVGVGSIAENHFEVLSKSKKINLFGITSKNYRNCYYLYKKYKFKVLYKNYKKMMEDKNIDAFYILVPPNKMYEVLTNIIPLNKPFFCEKPPALNIKQLSKIEKQLKIFKTQNIVGFNRRHYTIFHKALNEIQNKGKLKGVIIEGNERFWKIEKIKNKSVKDNWLFANSCHTIDLIRFFGGEVSNMKVNMSKSLNSKRNFTINFETNKGVIGTYNSFWLSPGGWSVKLFGEGISAFFEPLENGHIIYKTGKRKKIYPSRIDINYKMGFFNQMKAFERLLISKELSWPSQNIQNSVNTFKIIQKLIKND